MSEVSVKSSTKKAFTAPILKKSNNGCEINKSKVKAKSNKEVINYEPIQDTSNIPKKKIFKEKKKEEKSLKDVALPVSESKPKKLQVSLTDSQYEDIFSAVLKGCRSNPSSLHNTPQENFSEGSENLPKKNRTKKKRKDADENQNDLKRQNLEDPSIPTTPAKPDVKDNKTKAAASPWGSHFSKHSSQASSILKEYQESQSSLVVSSALMSPETTASSEQEEEATLSQRSLRQQSQVSGYGSQGKASPDKEKRRSKASTDQKKRLEELQSLRNVGVWVYCCRISCQKQRYLEDITDPQDVPDIWYCHMNPDSKYNSCLKEEQKLSPEEEEDMIYNAFTAGSIVWARVAGYPWWPAMVDDDPDLEQYYWLAEDFKNVTFYHVVFFDDVAVSRAWVDLKNITPYEKTANKFKQTVVRGIDYHRRLLVAKKQANDALMSNTTERLKIYSFIARYNGPINTSTTKVKKTMTKYKLKSNFVKKETNKKRAIKTEKAKVNNTEDEQLSKENKKAKNIESSVKKRKNLDKHINEPKSKKLKHDVISNHKKYNIEDNKKCGSSIENHLKKKARPVIEEKDNFKAVNKADLGISSVTPGKQKKQGIKNKSNKHVISADDIQNKIISGKVTSKKQQTSEFSAIENPLNILINKSTEQEQIIHKLSDLVEETLEVSDVEGESEMAVETNLSQKSRSSGALKKNIRDPRQNYNPPQQPPQSDSETPSLNVDTLSQKSRSSERRKKRLANTLQCTEDSIGSIVQPSQTGGEADDLESKHSQSTIADFLAGGTEDAVVPEAELLLSQNSLPFEE